MAAVPKHLAQKHKTTIKRAFAKSKRAPGLVQLTRQPSRPLTGLGQPRIKNGRIAPPALAKGPQILPFSSGTPLF